MTTISVNNDKLKLNNNTSVEDLLNRLEIEKEKYAVAVNGEFVPRSAYAEFLLKDSDQIDILTAVQGG